METKPQSTEQDGFNLKTHYLDKEGRLIKTDLYRLHCVSGGKFFERPPASGQFYFEDGNPVPYDKLPADLIKKLPKEAKPTIDSKQFVKPRVTE